MRRPLSLLAAAAVAAGLTLTTIPAAADNVAPNRDRYAAVGDSYAAGVGNTPVRNAGASLRSTDAYPVLLAGKVNKVTFLAASGATTTDVLLEQVPLIPDGARQVTVTVGGNDVGFAEVVTTCAAPQPSEPSTPTPCDLAIVTATAEVQEVVGSIAAVVGAIQARAPHATVYVTGYPLLFQCSLFPDPMTTQGRLDIAAAALNAAISGGVDYANALDPADWYPNAVFVDVTDEFAGAGICPAGGRYLFLPFGEEGVPLHPTALGQELYAQAIESAEFQR